MPIVCGEIEERYEVTDTCVIHQHRGTTEPINRGLCSPVYRLSVSHIDVDSEGSTSTTRNLGGHRLGTPDVAIPDGNMHAVLTQLAASRSTNTRASAGDDRDRT